MIGSLTVLPAVLSRLGDNVDRVRIPVLRGRPSDSGPWARVVAAVLRRPVVAFVLSAGALAAAALPALSMPTKLPNLTDLPHDLKIVRTYERIQHAFPGSQTPAVVVVRGPNVATPQLQVAYDLFHRRALATGEFFNPFTVLVNRDRTASRGSTSPSPATATTRRPWPRCTPCATWSSPRSHGRSRIPTW